MCLGAWEAGVGSERMGGRGAWHQQAWAHVPALPPPRCMSLANYLTERLSVLLSPSPPKASASALGIDFSG